MYDLEVPDGNYISASVDGAGVFFADGRLSVTGRRSLHLHAPSAGNSTTLSPYTVLKQKPNASMAFSVWTRGGKGGEQVRFTFTNGIFKPKSSNVLVVTATANWTKTEVALVATADPDALCKYNCRGWLNYALTTKGDVWVDDLSLSAA
jgi:hypothetical protein